MALVAVGAMGAFPPFLPWTTCSALLPVLDVTDNRRLSLWVAFGLSSPGSVRDRTHWLGASTCRALLGRRLGAGSIDFWAGSRFAFPGSSRCCDNKPNGITARPPVSHRGRHRDLPGRAASGRFGRHSAFLPRYYGLAACELLRSGCTGPAAARQGPGLASRLPPVLIGLTLIEVAHFGIGLNPAIAPEIQGFESPVITRLRRGLRPGQRALGIGEELPPNVLMRFGLCDARNYDSVELERSLQWFAPLFETGSESLSSRSPITWEGVHRARERLEAACVKAVVGASPPPPGRFARVERTGDVWITWLDSPAWASSLAGTTLVSARREPGRSVLRTPTRSPPTDSDPGDVGRWLDRPDRWRPRPDQHVSRYIHVGFGTGRRSCYPTRVPTRRSDLRADGLCPGNLRRDTRLDRTDAFLDSWNNQDRAWTDPGPEVRIEFVNSTGHLGPAHQF